VQKTIEQVFQDKAATGASVEKTQQTLNDLSAQQTAASKDLADARDADTAAEALLEKAVSLVPSDTIPVTGDGSGLVMVGGSLHVMKTAKASDLVFDDGNPTPVPTPTPPSEPAPSA
jgi:hypothetical protein